MECDKQCSYRTPYGYCSLTKCQVNLGTPCAEPLHFKKKKPCEEMKLIEDKLMGEDFNEGVTLYAKSDDGSVIELGHITKVPTVEAEPIRHGHWIPYEYGDYHWHKCSVCGVADKYIETVHRDGYPDKDVECIRHYCPNCGASMEGIEE